MTDDLRRQPRKVEQALVALEGVIAVRREYISLLQCLGTCDKKLTSLDALITARPGHVRSAARLRCRDCRRWAAVIVPRNVRVACRSISIAVGRKPIAYAPQRDLPTFVTEFAPRIDGRKQADDNGRYGQRFILSSRRGPRCRIKPQADPDRRHEHAKDKPPHRPRRIGAP